jgi:hypothetical protein
MQHLSLRAARLASDSGQIGVLIQRFDDGIKWPQDLIRGPPQRLGEHGTDATSHGQAPDGNRQTQQVSTGHVSMSTHGAPPLAMERTPCGAKDEDIVWHEPDKKTSPPSMLVESLTKE